MNESPTRSLHASGIYFAVPRGYGAGPTFATLHEAIEFARTTFEIFDYGASGKTHSRAFVEKRISDTSGDHPVTRWELYPGGQVIFDHGAKPSDDEPRDRDVHEHVGIQPGECKNCGLGKTFMEYDPRVCAGTASDDGAVTDG